MPQARTRFAISTAAWIQDTRLLSLQARGLWWDVLCVLHIARPRGKLALTMRDWGRQVSAMSAELVTPLCEIIEAQVCDCNLSDRGDALLAKLKDPTTVLQLACRRMLRETVRKTKAAERARKLYHMGKNQEAPQWDGRRRDGAPPPRSRVESTLPPELAVELPPSFPTTEEAALVAAEFIGCPKEFAAKTYELAVSRGGCDSRGIQIRNWRSHLSVIWKYERERIAKQEAKEAKKNGEPERADIFAWKAQLELVERQMADIRGRGIQTYAGGWNCRNDADREEYRRLKMTKTKLLTNLTTVA